jgi:glycosyltransferase involved in cell wall biosynthesis
MSKIGLDLRLWRAETGGIGRYSQNLLEELLAIDQENNYTAIIAPDSEREFQLKAPNLRRLVTDIPYYSPQEQTQLWKLLNKEKFDLVHFTQFNHPVLYRRPFVVTVHDIIMHLYPGPLQRKNKLRRLGYLATFNDCKRADRVIVPSQATKDDLVKKLHFPLEKINVIAEGSAKNFRPYSEAEQQQVIRKYALPKRYILFVSRWAEYKGLPALIEAFHILSARYPDLGLVITGKPDSQNPQVADIVRAAQAQNKNIVTPGFVPDEDLAPLYSAATVYVHPSWYEGFGIMILEAFASGVPVVTSNISSLPEVAGDAALLVDPRDSQEIAANIAKIIDDPQLAQSLIKKGQQRVKQYSWRQMAEETLAIYQQILAKKEPGR